MRATSKLQKFIFSSNLPLLRLRYNMQAGGIMKTCPISFLFGLLLTGCNIGLTSTGKVIVENDTGVLDEEWEASQPSVEPSNEPSIEAASEPASEPSNEPNSDPTRDDDNDGYSENQGDCNDSDPSINPSVHEIPSDDFDQNCDGKEICYLDIDSDGFATESVTLSQDTICGNNGQEALAFARTTDCNDYDANINPNAIEIDNDGIDQNCDGVDGGSATQDNDGDGYNSSTDCNDFDASIYPGATEIQNDGIDQDCDGSDAIYSGGCSSTELLDCNGICAPIVWLGDGACDNGSYSYNGSQIYLDCAHLNYDNGDCSTTIDLDGDGYDSTVDCNDFDGSIYPGAIEIQNDGIDQDCDGVDSTTSSGCSSIEIIDCQGSCAPAIWVGDGTCDNGFYFYGGNQIDLDCATHNNDGGDCYSTSIDADGDGYDASVDCNDNDAAINPAAIDIPNDGIDQNCDGADLTCSSTEIIDCQGSCAPAIWVGDGTCDNGFYFYGGNQIDLDCATHNNDGGDCYSASVDADGDGYDSSIDCDDSDTSIYPGATEIPNDGIDQNCDGSDLVSGCPSGEMEDCYGSCAPITWLGDSICDQGTALYNGNYIYLDCASLNYDNGDCSASSGDADGDGYDASIDCDDSDTSIYPGAAEIPSDGIDQDCDGLDTICLSYDIVDCNGNCAPSNWLGDGFCDQGNVLYNGNYIDLYCANLSYDNGDCSTGSGDGDGDGYDSSIDCNDSDTSIYPGALEIANDGIDQDCNGSDLICSFSEMADCNGNCAPDYWLGDGTCDNGLFSYNGNQIYFDCASLNYDNGDCATDGDGDGYDAVSDCDDSNASIYPYAFEISNDGVDQDCDGSDLICPSGEVGDCYGSCAPYYWLFDSYCDDGADIWNGNYINFDCPEHYYDNGACP